MDIQSLINRIDAEILKLTYARKVLEDIFNSPLRAINNPNPQASKMTKTISIADASPSVWRVSGMSPEGRARVAAATKARWAAKRQAAEQHPAQQETTKRKQAVDDKSAEDPRVARIKRAFSKPTQQVEFVPKERIPAQEEQMIM